MTPMCEVSGSILLLLWLWAGGGAGQVDGCPARCSCFREPRLTMACQQRGLTSVPSPAEIPGHVQRIFLQINKLTEIRSTAFSLCRNLTVLWLYSNSLRHIEAGGFAGLERLEELDLGDNAELRSISSTAFAGLARLQTLRLHRCGLSELPYGVFMGLSSLQRLYLEDNNLVSIHDNAFLDLANLAVLHLHNNRIAAVTDHMFRGLLTLDSLLLHQNRVGAVHRRAFHDMRRLNSLFLFHNNLTALSGEAMEPLVSLSYLRLNANPWICDCRAQSLWDWLKSYKGASSELECHAPEHLHKKDLKRLKSSELQGCYDSHRHAWTSLVNGRSSHYRKDVSATDAPSSGSGSAVPRCCLTNTDSKSSILSDKGLTDHSSSDSQQITKNPLKEKENISKTKGAESGVSKNGTLTASAVSSASNGLVL
ncbi:reticulon-4 receptor-like [Engraulis encrasicolus]|uniref:reticulon-4 receptor-like n=1 Tax=Engraulis encrasicolus TaxID=184585 RepID=UPI002FCFEA44